MANKDWRGNGASVFVCNGATGHSQEERAEHDFYASEPACATWLMQIEPQITKIFEPCVGMGHLAEEFRKAGKLGAIADLVDRGYYPEGIPTKYGLDFFKFNKVWKGDMATNPPFACYDKETEVLTRDGWKYFKDVVGTEDILSCNIETKELSYSKIKKVLQYDVDEELYHFESPFLDLKVTSNHRMFCVNYKKGYVQKNNDNNDVLTAKEVYRTSSVFPRYGYSFKSDKYLDYITIPGCYVSNGQKDIWHEDIKIPIDDWLRFFGLWIADGCYRDSLNLQGNRRYTISIKQHERTLKEVTDIVGALPFKMKVLKNKGRNSYNVEINSKQLWLFMSQFGKSHTKFIPTYLKELPSEKLSILLESYMFGDCGHYKNGGFLIKTVSKQLAEDLQEIMIKLGSIPSVSSKNYETPTGLKRTLWGIVYHKKPRSTFQNTYYGTPKKEKYRGKVYCVSLEKNGFMVVRRNGKVSISGNSATDWVEHSLELLTEGHYLALFMKITFLEGKARRELFRKYPPIRVWVSSSRLNCAKNGDFEKYGKGSAACYCWFIWQKGFKGHPEIRWFN